MLEAVVKLLFLTLIVNPNFYSNTGRGTVSDLPMIISSLNRLMEFKALNVERMHPLATDFLRHSVVHSGRQG